MRLRSTDVLLVPPGGGELIPNGARGSAQHHHGATVLAACHRLQRRRIGWIVLTVRTTECAARGHSSEGMAWSTPSSEGVHMRRPQWFPRQDTVQGNGENPSARLVDVVRPLGVANYLFSQAFVLNQQLGWRSLRDSNSCTCLERAMS